MRVNANALLSVLPPFTNKSVLIESVQEVPDIISEVVNAHKYFAKDYDSIYQFFNSDSIEKICRNLFQFCKENIGYIVETEEEQTTKSPSAMLAMGYGDCKHYAAFIAGILDAIRRNTGRKIDWRYRFGSYDYFNSDPGHVFVVVTDGKKDFWIDPVLNRFDERGIRPVSFTDKKILMPLYRVSGIGQPIKSGASNEFFNALENFYPVSSFEGGGKVGDFFDTLLDYGTTAASTSADAIAPGSGSIIDSIVSIFGGSDAVPDYPIKKQSTFDGLKKIVIDLCGFVAPKGNFEPRLPSSIVEAKQALDILTAEVRRQQASPGSGDAWTTIMMLYNETILSLQKFIQLSGQAPAGTSYPTGTTYPTNYPTGYPTMTPAPTGNFLTAPGLFGLPNWLTLGVAGIAIYYYSKKRR